MIDIYDELGYIKNVLSNGISYKWERDVKLLTRYYKAEGIKKSVARSTLKDKLEIAAGRSENPIAFIYDVNYKRFNSIFEKAWKEKEPLRQIHYIDIPKEAVDWFLNLKDDYTIDDDTLNYLKDRRPSLGIKSHPITWNRTKYLFTMYIWVKIKEQYVDRPNMLYIKDKNTKKRFKEDANLNNGFNLIKERDLLYDLGFINVNYALGIDTIFIKNTPELNVPITDENRVRIMAGDPPDGDLYNPGYWLEKQKMGSFVCQNCGKEFAHYSKSPREHARKYCKDCADIIGHGVNESDKYIKCVDCGKEVKIHKFDNKTCRCIECQLNKIRENDRLRKKLNI